MKIAVLVPVYNAERYLRECLDSLLAQQGIDLEIYCCNDGSADCSQTILDEYVSRCRNVHTTSQANAGVAVTRNRLIDRLPAKLDDWGIVNLKAPGHEAGHALCAALEEGAEMIMASLALLALLQSYLLFVHKNEDGEQNHL